MMHAKTAVVDGVWSTVGSYNFDAQSRFNNLEVTVEVLDPSVGAVLVTEFERDRAHCARYDEAAWLRLPWWTQGARLARLSPAPIPLAGPDPAACGGRFVCSQRCSVSEHHPPGDAPEWSNS